jgi:hypothetical protein
VRLRERVDVIESDALPEGVTAPVALASADRDPVREAETVDVREDVIEGEGDKEEDAVGVSVIERVLLKV